MSTSLMITWIIIAYIFGAIPSGYLLVKLLLKQDVRKQGSGNIGATNVLRTGGKKLGLLTYLLDVLKIWIPMFILYHTATPEHDISADTRTVLLMIIGSIGVIGHMYSVWLKFDGGKGVASFTAYMLFLSPYSAVIGLFVFALLVFATRIVSIASLCGVLVATLHAFFYASLPNTLDTHPNLSLIANILLGIIVLLIFWRHNGNIRRLLKGEEKKLKL